MYGCNGTWGSSLRFMIQVAGVPAYPILKTGGVIRSLWNLIRYASSLASRQSCSARSSSRPAFCTAKRLQKSRSVPPKRKPGASSTKPSRAEKAKSAKCCSKRRKRSINHAANMSRRSRSAARKSPSRSAVCSRRKKPLTRRSIFTRRKRTSQMACHISKLGKKTETLIIKLCCEASGNRWITPP